MTRTLRIVTEEQTNLVEYGINLGDPVTLATSIVNKINDALGDTHDHE